MDMKKEVLQYAEEQKGVRGSLIPVLQKVQQLYGYLPKESLEEIAGIYGIPTSEVYSLAVFYSDLKLRDTDPGESDTEFAGDPADSPDTIGQTVVLQGIGSIDPMDIRTYQAAGGYEALKKALAMKPEEVVNIIKESGLTGRGGANFPTGIKWESTARQEQEEKYVICNANEGDPGVFMDRFILANDPHKVIEGIVIAAYAVRAAKGYLYLREQSPKAEKSVREAVGQAYENGFLGKGIAGSGFAFELEIRIGAGAYVSGEETALIASIESRKAYPSLKPPYPFEHGLFEAPTVVDNVETLANVPEILRHGAEWFRAIGDQNNAGTKVLSVTGDVEKEGVLEVEMGTKLADVLAACGGMKGGAGFKAVFAGGPSGGAVTDLETPVDYPSFAEKGASLGSGGISVYKEGTSMVNVARDFCAFAAAESCGKCSVCRIGTKRMLEMLDTFVAGKAEEGDIDRLEQLAEDVKAYSRCGLGQTAPNPILSTIRNFRGEYQKKIGR